MKKKKISTVVSITCRRIINMHRFCACSETASVGFDEAAQYPHQIVFLFLYIEARNTFVNEKITFGDDMMKYIDNDFRL